MEDTGCTTADDSRRLPSTEQTRSRYAILRKKRAGDVWEEGSLLYRMGDGGVTVFDLDFERPSAKPLVRDRQGEEIAALAKTLWGGILTKDS